MPINASMLYKREEIIYEPKYTWKYQLKSLCGLRDSSENVFSFYLYIMGFNVGIFHAEW